MKKNLLLSVTFLIAIFLFPAAAQNYVPDSSFEQYHRLPSKENNSIACTKYWLPTNGAGDYYHDEAGKHAGVPANIFGRQKPHSGKAYGGICIRKNFIEYLETKLIDTLEKDQEYLVEFFICKAERSIGSVNQFGVLFTRKPIWGIANTGIQKKPNIVFVQEKGYRNKKEWTKLSAVYRAGGDEASLIIGYFNYDRPEGKRIYSHYYIDDVSVTPIVKATNSLSPVTIEKVLPTMLSIVPERAIVFKNLFFETNKSELLQGSFTELDELFQYLIEYPQTSVEINGHTDNTGNENKNKNLSEERAKAVADYLIKKGLDKARIKHFGYGSTKPITANDTEEGKKQNRRVEFIIRGKQ
jgi:OmpA-OmpF porin, OOP family